MMFWTNVFDKSFQQTVKRAHALVVERLGFESQLHHSSVTPDIKKILVVTTLLGYFEK